MRLVDWYRCYYENPSRDNAQHLFRAIMAYEYADFEDFQELAWETRASFQTRKGLKKREGFSAMSTGTLSAPTSFDVGPNGWWWQREIERFIKNPTARPHVFLDTTFHPFLGRFMRDVFEMRRYPGSHIYDWFFKLDPVIDLPSKGISLLRDLSSPMITLRPNVLLYCAKEAPFIEYLIEDDVVLGTTEFHPFYPEVPVHVNDNMIDWKTGLNFWTCPHGAKHFLPLFAVRDNRAYNLVNLHCGDKSVDDLFEINYQVLQCPCGRKFLSFDFIPHVEAAIRFDDGSIFQDLGLANRLHGQYQNLQFIQNADGSVDVLYVCGDCQPMPKEDEELIGLALAGLDFSFKKDQYLTTDQKFFAFHKNIREEPYQQWPRRKPFFL